jgi:hypothetical protein
MKPRVIMWACVGFSCAAMAADISMTGTDALGASSFNTGTNWPGKVAPLSGNTLRNLVDVPERPVPERQPPCFCRMQWLCCC